MGALNGQELQIDDGPVEALAIIGLSARLPGDAVSAEGLWNMLRDNRTAHGKIPEDRLHAKAFYHPNPDRTDSISTATGHFLEGNIAAFDAPFFSIQPSEARSMDPQQRILLETTYRALENAGVSLENAAGSITSVYVGTSSRDYETLQSRDPEVPAKYLGTGIGTALLANRLSWFFDLRGPSISLDTACSSSLNAFHLACQSLRNKESNMALIGGVNLIIAPDSSFMHLSNMGFLSPDGHSYSFDSRANGYAKGEGAAIVVLKRLKDALSDGDTIRAVIRSSGSNQDGRTPGITQPSQAAQETNIRNVYHNAGLCMSTTQFLEAHGTGTQVGDPIEAGAIAAAFQRSKENPLHIGAVKSSIGHLEAAAGIAALIKAVLVVEKGVIPRNALYEQPNTAILMERWHVKFPTKLMPWPTPGLRRASVNAFGYGGTNAHVVIDDAYHYLKLRNLKGSHNTTSSATALTTGELFEHCNGSSLKSVDTNGYIRLPLDSPRIFFYSAADEAGLKRLAAAYEYYLSSFSDSNTDQQDTFLENLSYTLSNKRSDLPWKAFTIANSVDTLRQNLIAGLSKPVRSSISPCLAFVFTGQGAQWYAMGRELEVYTIFKESLAKAEHHLCAFGCQWYLLDELHKAENCSRIDDPEFSQPICTALQLALVDLLYSWNVRPQAVVGHSSGEIAAAYCIGALSFDSALKVSYHRGRLAASLAETTSKPGAMVSIAMSEAEIGPYLEQVMNSRTGEAVIGCVNSPGNVTVSGDVSCIDALQSHMEEQGVFARKLKVTLAYHSPHMRAIAAGYLKAVQNIEPGRRLSQNNDDVKEPMMFSSVYGSSIQPGHLSDPQYWVTNMVSTVRFSEALKQLTLRMISEQGNTTKTRLSQIRYLEIGPHSALRRPLQDTVSRVTGVKSFNYDSLLERGASATETCLQAIGRLRCSCFAVDTTTINIRQPMVEAPHMLVNLPGYPFNHDQTFWHEPRTSRNYRFRKWARHELLGSPSVDWNPLEPKWRNIIKMTENPWMRDHKMSGLEMYPAAGMIVMAVEAARQITDPTMVVQGYRLKDLQFLKALRVSSAPDGVETQFHLHPLRGVGKTSTEYDFALYVHTNDDWSLVSRGLIAVEFLESDLKNDDVDRTDHVQHSLWDTFDRGNKACNRSVDGGELYRGMARYGCDFGPAHQVLQDVWYNGTGEARATIDLDGWAAKVNADPIKPHVIHPTALDGVIQLAIVAFSQGASVPFPTMIPTNVKSIWISNSLLDRSAGAKMDVFAKTTFKGYREADFWIAAFNGKDAQIVIDDWRQMAVTNLDLAPTKENGSRRLCYNLVWQPDVTLLSPNKVKEQCEVGADAVPKPPRASVIELELVTCYFIASAREILGHNNLDPLPATHSKYIEWMRMSSRRPDSIRQQLDSSNEMRLEDAKSREVTFEKMARSGAHGALTVAVGKSLLQILRGDSDPLELLFGGSLARDFYYGETFAGSYAKIAKHVELMAHKNPGLKILEIGAGTGAATTPIVQTLWCRSDNKQKSSIARFEQYDFTDVSPSFFDQARQSYKEYGEKVNYRVLDIEKDPLQQGFEGQYYDVVVCSMVLHATAELKSTLENAKRLLAPEGKLIILEPTNKDCVRLAFIFGLLPGWWRGTEETRQWGPLLSDEEWDSALKDSGFTGAEVCLRDYKDPDAHTYSVIVSSAVNPTPPQNHLNRPTFIIATEDSLQRQLAAELSSALRKDRTADIHIASDEELHSKCLDNSVCIFLLELQEPYLVDIRERQFAFLKKMVTRAHAIVWVTKGTGEKPSNPDLDLVTGFGRNARLENWGLNFVHLAIEGTAPRTEHINQIAKVYYEVTTRTSEQCESGYREENGTLHIGRVVEAEIFNELVQTKITRNLQPQESTLGQNEDRALLLSIATPGLLDTLHFADDDLSATPLAPDEIEIQPKAVGLNFKDVLIALGNIAGSHLGIDCAGIVSRAGADAGFEIGDRVCCCTSTGSFKTRVRTPSSLAAEIADGMSFNAAATIPSVFCTAWYALCHVARLREGESILIHSGAGGVGQAAIQLARLRNANIFTTVGTIEKKNLLMKQFGIPEQQIFSSRSPAFEEAIKTLTGGVGVDVILNSLSGDLMRASWSCVAPFGRFVELGKTDIVSGRGLSMDPFLKNVTFSSVDLALAMNAAKPLMAEIMSAVMELFRNGSIECCQPLHVYGISEIEKAFRFMQSGKNTGKIVVEMEKESPVMVVPASGPTYSFHTNATYVISGGLGGIGQSIIRWMVGRGARSFLLLSRSGATSQAAQKLLLEMERRSVRILAPSCDISSEKAVTEVIEKYTQSMPPIKGCIQSSMVLKDGLFESMTHSDFRACLAPKVQGSWNLHKHLPSNLDFFVMLSSVASITGSRGQSNYAAGCSYQDALARYRTCQGQKAVSLNLGPVLSVGLAAEKDLTADLARTGFESIREDELLALLDWACDPALPIPTSTSQHQVMTGFGGARDLKPGQEAYWMQHRHFSVLKNARDSSAAALSPTASEQGSGLGAQFAAASTKDARQELSEHALVQKLARALNVPAEDIDPSKPIHAFGVDSLVALEVRYWFMKELKANIAVLEIMGSPSLSMLAGIAAEKSEYRVQHALEDDRD